MNNENFDKIVEYCIYESLLENCDNELDEGFLSDRLREIKDELSDFVNMPKNLFNRIKNEVKRCIDAPKNFIQMVKQNAEEAKSKIQSTIDSIKTKVDFHKPENKALVKASIYDEFDFNKMPNKYIKDFDSFVDDCLE